MQIGDLNVVNTIINLQSGVMKLEYVLNFIFERNSGIIKPSPSDINKIDIEIMKKLHEIYPNMGIQKK
jgi:hypothetical protein